MITSQQLFFSPYKVEICSGLRVNETLEIMFVELLSSGGKV
jgi:hypothetical protein